MIQGYRIYPPFLKQFHIQPDWLFYYKEKLYTAEERENILLSILDENKRRINSREFKGYDLETELEYNRFLIQERAVTERLEPIKEEERTLGKKIRVS